MRKVFLFLFTVCCLAQLSATVNPKPFVIPELREWTGKQGDFTLTDNSRIVVVQPELTGIAQKFADDWNTMFGKSFTVVTGKPQKGDIFIKAESTAGYVAGQPYDKRNITAKNKKNKLPEQGYRIDIAEKVEITAADPEGAFWSTRTLLQIAQQSDSHSFPKGKITDWPDYGIRGLSFDVGRKFFPLDYIEDLVEIMAYYKLNSLRLHLNDNGFPHYFNNDWDKTYSAFRLESDTYPGLTARDGYYTKEEFRNLQKYAAGRFVDIMPEIDIPAHSLAFAKYMPELGSEEFGKDHLNLFNPNTIPFLDKLFEEYLGGDDPVFIGPNMHIGTDEFGKDYPGFDKKQETIEKFRAFADHYIRLVEGYGKQPWVWGALSVARGETPVKTDGVILDAWYNGYADPKEMIDLGFKLNSIPDGFVYIVPGAHYYHDYLNTEWIYNNWTPAKIGNVQFEELDPNIVGGYFAVWNDIVGNGLSVQDIHHRLMPALQTMAVKLWDGINVTLPYQQFFELKDQLSEAPGINRLGRAGDPNSIVFETATLQPGQKTGISDLGYDWTLEFDILAAEEKKGTILFSSPESTFYLSDPVKGLFGFTRDGYHYTFNFKPYPGEKAKIKLSGNNKSTSLSVNDKPYETLDVLVMEHNGGKNNMDYYQTLMLPLEEAGNFKSKISNVKVYNYIP